MIAIAGIVPAWSPADEAVSGKVLDNGLVIYAQRTPARGLVTVDVKVLAGSSQEGRYLASGVSHLVEHMLFKGTATRRPGDIEREIKSYGGVMNGSVSADLADYHITLPADRLPQAISLIKDIFMNASFDPAEIDRERDVIRSEIRLGNDEPQRTLVKVLHETAYRVHPYRYPPIGYEALLSGLTRDDLIDFYTTRYVPNRMVIAIVGGIEPKEAIAAVEQEFTGFRKPDYGSLAALPPEPLQMDKRFYQAETKTTLGYLALGYHSTELSHADLYALDVLAMILGRGDTSRLNTALYKEKRLVHTISSWNHTPRDAGLFAVTAIADPAKIDAASRSVLEEIERIKTTPVTDAEIEGARRTVKSDHIFTRETTDGLADDITSNAILTGSPAFSARYIAGVEAVTKEDIRRVARQYLIPTNRTEVRLIPAAAEKTPLPATAEKQPEERFSKTTLDNGLRVLIRKNDASPSLAITVAMLGGLMAEDADSNGLSSMVSRMLFKGTRSRKESELIGAIQRMGGTADSFSGISSFGFTITCLKEDALQCLSIIHDILSASTFPEDELAKEKERTLALIREEDDDLFEHGFRILRQKLYSESPYGMRYLGEKKSVSSMTRSATIDFYHAYCTADNMVIVVSGDIEPVAIRDEIRTRFSGLTRTAKRPPFAEPPEKPLTASSDTVTMEKEETLVLTGYRAAPLGDPDRYALAIAGSVLSGQSGRMFATLRGKQSLAYALGCTQKLSMRTGFFAFYVATAKEMLPRTRTALDRQVAAIRTDPVSAEELASAKQELSTSHRADLQRNASVTANAALEELCGRGADNIFSYERALDAVTVDDVTHVAEKYLDPAMMVTVIVTPPQ